MRTCEAMANEGHEVVLFAQAIRSDVDDVYRYYGCEPVFEVVLTSRAPAGRLGRPGYSLRVARRVLGDGRFDALWGRDVLALALAARRIPFVYETHGPPRNRLLESVERRLLRRPGARGVAVQHETLRRLYLERYPWLGDHRIAIVPNTAFTGSDAGPAPYRWPAWWPGRPGCMQAGYVGSLWRQKGIAMLLRVAEGVPEIDVHVIGGTDGEIRTWRSASPAANLHFHGAVAPADLPEYFGPLDCLLAPHEAPRRLGRVDHLPVPSKLFEYMGHGRAICATDNAAIRSVLEHGRDAWLLPPADVDAWVRAVRLLAADPDRRRALGRAARNTLESRYTMRHRARALLQMLERAR